jgi:uncharacterized protein
MARILPAVLLLATLDLSCGNSPRPPGATVTIKGRKYDVTGLATERERRTARLACTTPPDGRGYLLLWPRERFLKLEPLSDTYDVAFLDRAGKVVDLGKLDNSNPEGLVPQSEATGVLLLPGGDLAKLGLQKGDSASISGAPAAQELPVIRMGGVTATVELALTEPERRQGLMFRPRMSADDGMLFAYPSEAPRTFWMMNTLIPLDIAFFAADGTLLNVNETPIGADPRREPVPRSSSTGPARYVLEMNLGWFKKKGLVDADGKVKPGIKATLPPEAVNESTGD